MTTNDKDLYDKLCLFRSHGIEKNETKFSKNDGPWYHEQQVLGYNYRLTDVQSALGISQMNKVDRFINRRRDIVRKYNEAFRSLNEIITPFEAEYSNSGWHLYVIQIKTELLTVDKKQIFNSLLKENIGVNLHYIPVYQHPYYKELGYAQTQCPNAERYYDRAITLPLFPSMSDVDIASVIEAVIKVITFYRK